MNPNNLLKTSPCPKCGRPFRVGNVRMHAEWCGKMGVDADAFDARLERIPFSGCWIWMGPTYNCGYGTIGWRFKPTGNRTMIAAHRAAWMLANGPIPEGIDVCHHCDVRLCCNPSHLFLGTHIENMADMWRKGRGYRVWVERWAHLQSSR